MRIWPGLWAVLAACSLPVAPQVGVLPGTLQPSARPSATPSATPRPILTPRPSLRPGPSPTPSAVLLTPYERLAASFSREVPVRPVLRAGERFFSREPRLRLVDRAQVEELVPLEMSGAGVPVLWPSSSPIVWTCDRPEVVTVSSGGRLSVVAEGEARVTAQQGARVASLEVEVRFLPVGGHYFDRSLQLGRLSGPAEWMTPMPVYVAPSGPGPSIDDYRLRALMALETWQEANSSVRFSLVDDPGKAYISVDWVTDLSPFGSEERPVPDEAAAMTLSEASYAGETDTLVNTRAIHCLVRDKQSGEIFSAVDMQKILTHELGHALGISGHSPDSGDIMYGAVTPDNSVRLSERDVATLQWALFATPNLLSFQVLQADETVCTLPR